MPCNTRPHLRHREKNTRVPHALPCSALVARPVGKHELNREPLARASVDKEWKRLRDKHVWDEDHPREWDDVRAEAKRKGIDVHMGYLFDICVEKNSELADVNGVRNPLRKYKGRVVFQGNRVVNQYYDQAIFQDFGSAPATMEAAKIADFYGCGPGNCVETADAEQAYVQAEMKGTPTWVCLPPEQRTDWWKKSFPHLR